jgi:hypothetical protein
MLSNRLSEIVNKENESTSNVVFKINDVRDLSVKKKLEELVDNSKTDKNTVHSYLPLYQQLLEHKKESAKNVLEIGINLGGSIKLWRDFFVNSHVHGLDIMHINDIWSELKKDGNITLYTSNDAYNIDFFNKTFLNKIKFDFMLDDGPHSLDSMKRFINLYSQVIADDGILIIEDVQSITWIPILINEVPEHLKKYIEVYDLRPIKNRYDDIVFVINKSKSVI